MSEPRPEYLDHRIELFEKFAQDFAEVQAALPRKDIKVTFPQGDKEAVVTSNETNVFQAAKAAGVDKKLINRAVCAICRDLNGEPLGLVNGQWDMERPLEVDCSVELKDFETKVCTSIQPHSRRHSSLSCRRRCSRAH
jgi:threonyl-tRNA synthetase